VPIPGPSLERDMVSLSATRCRHRVLPATYKDFFIRLAARNPRCAPMINTVAEYLEK
jgi:hypothetical protein